MTEQTPAGRVERFLAAWDAAPIQRTRPRHVISSQSTMDSTEPYAKLADTDLRDLVAEIKRLEAELERLSDFDRIGSDRQKLGEERDRAVQRWHERGKRIKELEAENHRLAEELAMVPGRKKRKLDGGTAREIRAVYAAGGASQQTLAERYGVGQTMISRVILGKAWSGTGEDSTPRSTQ